MGYRLKSGLSKTAIYNLVKDHLVDGFPLPKMRECEFVRRSRFSMYWLNFGYNDDRCYEICVCPWRGSVTVQFVIGDWLNAREKYVYTQRALVDVPFEYLNEHGLIIQDL